MKLLLLIALVALVSAQTDRRCGDNLSKLWLDVVAVVDNSIGMTRDGLQEVAANIATVFSSGTIIGTRTGNPRTTRVGLVTYSKTATINAGLDDIQSVDQLYNNVFNDLSNVSTSVESYLINGLNAAEQVLNNGNTAARAHYKRVVIVYASAYEDPGSLNPIPAADRLKTHGVTIITVAFSQDQDNTLLKGLSQIASTNDNFSNDDESGHLVGEIQGALLQANCFCPISWTQYRATYNDVFSFRYGVCIKGVNLNANWRSAKYSCRNLWTNAFLVSEYNQHKHDYVFEVVKNMTGMYQPYSYNIGLSLQSGQFFWEQPFGVSPVPLSTWTDWNSGYPLSTGTLTGVVNMQSSAEVQTGWMNVDAMKSSSNYACEVASCDTDNYCDQSGITI